MKLCIVPAYMWIKNDKAADKVAKVTDMPEISTTSQLSTDYY